MEDKKSILRRKLEAIQELKANYYIGTRDAKDYLDAFVQIDERPRELSCLINARIPPPITYPAAPERVLGIANELSDVFGKEKWIIPIESKTLELLTEGDFLESIILRSHPIKGEFLAKLFVTANQRQVKTDTQFIQASTSYTVNRLRSEIGYVSARENNSLKNFQQINHNALGSKEEIETALDQITVNANALFDIGFQEKEIKMRILKSCENMTLDPQSILSRIIRDKAAGRFEYRRQVITRLAQVLDAKSYGNIKEYTRKNLEEERQRYEECISLNVLEFIRKNMERKLKRAETMIQIIADDRNFLEKYLTHEQRK